MAVHGKYICNPLQGREKDEQKGRTALQKKKTKLKSWSWRVI